MAPARDELVAYERRYRELALELSDVGMIQAGSVTRRFTRCGSPGCQCHTDASKRHGPYYQWTTKVQNKTVTKTLSEKEAEIYQEWIANDRRLRALVKEMREVAAKALSVKLADENESLRLFT